MDAVPKIYIYTFGMMPSLEIWDVKRVPCANHYLQQTRLLNFLEDGPAINLACRADPAELVGQFHMNPTSFWFEARNRPTAAHLSLFGFRL